jgi:hypothetical protein
MKLRSITFATMLAAAALAGACSDNPNSPAAHPAGSARDDVPADSVVSNPDGGAMRLMCNGGATGGGHRTPGDTLSGPCEPT